LGLESGPKFPDFRLQFQVMNGNRSGGLTRRSFLKLGGLGLSSLLVAPFIHGAAQAARLLAGEPAPLADFRSLNPDQQGRVLEPKIWVYAAPSFGATKLQQIWLDTVFQITDVTVGDVEPEFNRIWYRVGETGYVHSGSVQPVRTLVNPPVGELPPGGALAEVTVPFADARWEPGSDQLFAYRFYYETTHWVNGLQYAADGSPWYSVLDDKWQYNFYVPAAHLRILPVSELVPLSPDVPNYGKLLEVRTAEQVVVAYEWDQPIFMARAATGAKFSDGDFTTQPGIHITNHKRPSRHMAAGNLAYNGYDLPGVPWICYFTESGISFHGTYWHNNFGRPRSHGCVNLTPQAAKWIYRWTEPVVLPNEQMAYQRYGTTVQII
jgi:hypothetical protein